MFCFFHLTHNLLYAPVMESSAVKEGTQQEQDQYSIGNGSQLDYNLYELNIQNYLPKSKK